MAEPLTHISVDLIQRHFAVSADTAQQFMERLVQEKRFGDGQADGWNYPPVRNCGATGRIGNRWPPTTRRLKRALRTSRS